MWRCEDLRRCKTNSVGHITPSKWGFASKVLSSTQLDFFSSLSAAAAWSCTMKHACSKLYKAAAEAKVRSQLQDKASKWGNRNNKLLQAKMASLSVFVQFATKSVSCICKKLGNMLPYHTVLFGSILTGEQSYPTSMPRRAGLQTLKQLLSLTTLSRWLHKTFPSVGGSSRSMQMRSFKPNVVQILKA